MKALVRVASCSALVAAALAGTGFAEHQPRPPKQSALAEIFPRDRSVLVPGKVERRYWADPATSSIRRSNPDGSNEEVVISGLNEPYGISYDKATKDLVWTSGGDEKVQHLRVGSTWPDALESSFEPTFALNVSEPDCDYQFVYAVIDGAVVRIEQNRQTGEEQRQVLAPLPGPGEVRGMALSSDGNSLYLGDAVGRMAHKLKLATNAIVPLDYIDEVPAPAAALGKEQGR